jgi:hypothetical protein
MSDDNKNISWIRTAVLVGIVFVIAYACSHVEDEISKVDGFTKFFLGAIIFGLIFVIINMSANEKK